VQSDRGRKLRLPEGAGCGLLLCVAWPQPLAEQGSDVVLYPLDDKTVAVSFVSKAGKALAEPVTRSQSQSACASLWHRSVTRLPL
jgi:hypothetical protein